MHVQVTLLDRPLPPGEGRGEGLCHSGSESIIAKHQRLTPRVKSRLCNHRLECVEEGRHLFRAADGHAQLLLHVRKETADVYLAHSEHIDAPPHLSSNVAPY